MKTSEIRGRSREDILTLMKDLQNRLFELTSFGPTEENPDSGEPLKLRRDIARCKTILTEMETKERVGGP